MSDLDLEGLKIELDDYNRKYMLSDAEQNIIKAAQNFYSENSGIMELELREAVKEYNEIKAKLNNSI